MGLNRRELLNYVGFMTPLLYPPLFSTLFIKSGQALSQNLPHTLSPLSTGDADVFSFIVQLLKKESLTPTHTREKARKFNHQETLLQKRIKKGEALKPFIACAQEGELAFLLKTFCQADKRCKGLGLYTHTGQLLNFGNNQTQENIDVMISDEIYDRYLSKASNQPTTTPHKVIYPVFLSGQDSEYGSFTPYNPTDPLIGFIVMHTK